MSWYSTAQAERDRRWAAGERFEPLPPANRHTFYRCVKCGALLLSQDFNVHFEWHGSS